MNKYTAGFCITAICTLGCSNLPPMTETAAHFSPSFQAVLPPSFKPAPAELTVNTPEIDSANRSFRQAQDGGIEQAPTKATRKQSESPPTTSPQHQEAVAVARVRGSTSKDALEESFCRGIREVTRTVVDLEQSVSHSVSATCMGVTLFVKDVGAQGLRTYPQRRTPPSEQAPQAEISKKVWYFIAWIGGALFTSILAPLIVDWIKLRIASGRPRVDARSPTG
jgi:hypothetical protein